MSFLVVTGGFGLVGSAIVKALNQRGIVPKVIDRWDNPYKWRNIKGILFERIEEKDLSSLSTVIHCGASVDTKEKMTEDLWRNNVEWTLRLRRTVGKFIYMSSMSVYGNSDDMTERLDVEPLCPYALTKAHIDQMLFADPAPNTYALRLSNVYGPRETHKGDMASLVTKGLLKQFPLYSSSDRIFSLGGPNKPCWGLFKHPSGETIQRDFVFSEDVAQVVLHFLEHDSIPSGIYNLGSGQMRSFEDLVTAVEKLPIEYVPLPDALKNQYQFRTIAPINKLRDKADYHQPFTTLEQGIEKTRTWMKEEGLL